MKLYTTSKIDLEALFNTDEEVNAKLYVKQNGRQYFAIKQVKMCTLKMYLGSCQLLIHKILEHQNLKNTNWLVNIPCKSLDALIGSRKRITSTHLLHELGIIEINHSYNHSAYFHYKRFSKSYRISDDYVGDITTVDGCITLRGVPTKIAKDHDVLHQPVMNGGCITSSNQLSDYDLKEEGCSTLRDILELGNTTVDPPIVIHPSYQYQIGNLRRLRYDKQRALEYLSNNVFKDPYLIRSQIEEMGNGCAVSIGRKTGKVFTLVNRIKREFRQFIIDGHNNPLHEIDFTTSHLNHLIKVIRDDIKSGTYVPMFSVEYFSEEMVGFKAKVTTGDFYTHVESEFNREFKTRIDRDKAKSFVLFWLNSGYQNWRGVKLLRTRFPQITHYIDTINSTDRRVLGIKLQRSEALLINELLLGKMATCYPESLAFTIFDGVLIEGEYLNQLLEIIKTESISYLGFEARVKRKTIPPPIVGVKKKEFASELPKMVADTTKKSYELSEFEREHFDYFKSKLMEMNSELLNQPDELYSKFKEVMIEVERQRQELSSKM